MVSQIETTKTHTAQPIGKVYISECIGSIAGGILFTYFLVELSNQFLVLCAFAIIIAFFSLILFFSIKKTISRTIVIVPFIISLIGIPLLIWFGYSDSLNNSSIIKRWNSFNPNIEYITSADTKYENLSLGKQEDLYSMFGNGQYMLSFPDPYQYASYAHLALSQHPSPKNILLIGGGLGGLLSEILLHPIESVDYVELDPALITLVTDHLEPPNNDFLKDSRLTIHLSDGRYFVKHTENTYDIVLINVSDPSTAFVNRYYTLNFYNEVLDILKPNGVCASQISSGSDYLDTDLNDYIGSVYQTLKKVFSHIVVTPGTQNYFFAAQEEGVITTNPNTLSKRYTASGTKSRYFKAVILRQFFQPDRVSYINSMLKKTTASLVNTDFKPITYYLNFVLWDRYSGSHLNHVLGLIRKIRFKTILLVLILFFLLRLFLSRKKAFKPNLRFNTLTAIFITGMAGMAFEIALILMYQNTYGYIYQKIGLLLALFMAGLTVGSILTNTLFKRIFATFIIFESTLLVFALALPIILWHISLSSTLILTANISMYIFYILVFVSGFLTGGEFPLANKLYFSTQKSLGHTAGMIDGWDCFGAACGALLTGMYAIPILGLTQTCILIAVLKGGCIALFVTQKRQS